MIKQYTADIVRTQNIRRKPVGNGAKSQCTLLWICAAIGSAVEIYGFIRALKTADFTILGTAFFSTFAVLCLIGFMPTRYFK